MVFAHFAEELAGTDLKVFSPLRAGGEEDPVLPYRSRTELWGRERTVVVTHNRFRSVPGAS
jgi:hypothetical protein